MGVENRPEHQPYLEPPKELALEMSFGTVMRRAIDDLFTCRPVAEQLEGIEEDTELAAFVEGWKQEFTEQLVAAGYLAVDSFLTDLERFQSQRGDTSSPPALEPDPNIIDQQ